MRGLVNDLPAPLRAVFEKVLDQFPGGSAGLQELSQGQQTRVAAAVALVGYLIAGVPHVLFFTFVTFVVAFVPAVGAGGAGLAAAAALPHPRRRRHPRGGVFFALLGGLASFGPIGLLLGPLVVAFFLAVVRIVRREYPRDA